MKHALVVASVLGLVVGGEWGCASGKTVAVGTTSVSFDEAIERSDLQFERIQSLSGDGTLRVETSSFSQSGDFALSLRKPDSIQITVEGPFGIRVAQALITRSTFQAYSALENTLYTGPTSAENLRKAIRLDLGFDDVMALFVGGRVLLSDRRTPDESGTDGSDAFFLFRDDSTGRRYVVDPASLAIRKVQLLDRNGTMTFEQTYADFADLDGVRLPRMIRATNHKRRQIITLTYNALHPNDLGVRFSFSPPRNARRVEWK